MLSENFQAYYRKVFFSFILQYFEFYRIEARLTTLMYYTNVPVVYGLKIVFHSFLSIFFLENPSTCPLWSIFCTERSTTPVINENRLDFHVQHLPFVKGEKKRREQWEQIFSSFLEHESSTFKTSKIKKNCLFIDWTYKVYDVTLY